MREHFRPESTMRNTYPWRHLIWVLCSGFMVSFGLDAMREGFLTSIMVFVVHASLYAGLMTLGAEHYRYARYKGAKKAYGHMLKRNEKLGWE